MVARLRFLCLQTRQSGFMADAASAAHHFRDAVPVRGDLTAELDVIAELRKVN